MKPYTILFQKTKPQSVLKNSEKDFSIVCLREEIPDSEIKELPNNDWADNHGNDVFIPNTIKEKATSLTINAGYKGDVNLWESKMDDFLDYLTGHDGSGVEVMIYFPYKKFGRVGILSKLPKPTPFVSNGEMVLEFSMEFAINAPRDRVDTTLGVGGAVTSLTRRIR